MLLRDGFPGQRLRVLPRPVVRRSLRQPMTSSLLVTDAGYFPHAARHGRVRERGADEAVVILCAKGSGSCWLKGTELRVAAGQVLVVPPHVPHRYAANDGDPWTIWWVHVTGSQLSQVLELLCPAATATVVDVHQPLRAVALLDEISSCLGKDETVSSILMASGLCWALLAVLGADASAGTREKVEPIRLAQEHLRRHYDRPVSVPDLARSVGLSTSHFSALFRSATGSGVLDYVKRLRMARACELLISTSRTVGDVAASTGYTDPFYFSRQFRAVHGCSPSEYRKHYDEQSRPPRR